MPSDTEEIVEATTTPPTAAAEEPEPGPDDRLFHQHDESTRTEFCIGLLSTLLFLRHKLGGQNPMAEQKDSNPDTPPQEPDPKPDAPSPPSSPPPSRSPPPLPPRESPATKPPTRPRNSAADIPPLRLSSSPPREQRTEAAAEPTNTRAGEDPSAADTSREFVPLTKERRDRKKKKGASKRSQRTGRESPPLPPRSPTSSSEPPRLPQRGRESPPLPPRRRDQKIAASSPTASTGPGSAPALKEPARDTREAEDGCVSSASARGDAEDEAVQQKLFEKAQQARMKRLNAVLARVTLFPVVFLSVHVCVCVFV